MVTMTVNGKEYKIQYGFNSFCDTDVLDRVNDMVKIFQNANAKSDEDVSSLGMIKELFALTRDLVFIGLEKKNPLNDLKEAGDLLDDYRDEAPEGEERSVMSIFGALAGELLEKGFLSDIMGAMQEENPKKKTRK